MSTCEKCGIESQSLAYHRCQLTEERVRRLATEAILAWHPTLVEEEKWVRELARDEIRLHVHDADLEDRLERDRCVRTQARDSALEEAAQLIMDWNWGSSALHSEAIRSLKSQPAAQASTEKTITWRQHAESLEKENDTLRAKLAEAEKALDDLAAMFSTDPLNTTNVPGWMWNGNGRIDYAVPILQRTGRLTPRKQEEPR